TISTILSRGYVEREKKALKPTELGELINEIMESYFSDVVNVGFTAEREEEFDAVENGDVMWKDVIRNFYSPFEKLLSHAEEDIEKVDLTEETDIDCEKCG
ncbi:DNA topoisomerase, type IA like protein, partial [Aduncisulcus paluster]